jgi:capsular polysaccharide biosynthesis protein
MELRRYAHILRRHVVAVVVVIAVALGLGYVRTSRVKMYQAQAVLFVGQKSIGVDDPVTGAPQSDPIQAAQLLAATYARMLMEDRTAAAAIQATGVARSAAQVANETLATTVNATTLLVVMVKDRDPRVAAVLANGEANALTAEIKQMQAGVAGAEQQPVSLFQPAAVPTAPLKSQRGRNLLLFGIFGIVVAIVLVVVVEYLDVTVRRAVDIEHRIELPVLGVVPLQRVDA